MILKSFYRKKTTKIYLLIFMLIFTIFGVVLIGKSKYIEKINQDFSDSFIYLSSNSSLNLSDIEGAVELKKAIKDDRFVYTYNDEKNIGKDEVIIPNILKGSFALNDFMELNVGNTSISLRVKEYYEHESVTPIIYLNKESLEQLIGNSGKYSYILKIKEWNKHEEISERLINTYHIDPIVYSVSKSNMDLSQTVKNFSTYGYIIIGIFVIVSVFTVYNIISDAKKKNYIYRSLGYSKSKILVNLIYNIASLFLLSLIGSGVLVLIISGMLK